MPSQTTLRRTDVEAALAQAFRVHAGAAAESDLLREGLTPHDVARLVRIGRIVERHRGIYVDAGSATSPLRESHAAVLATGALLSHTSAASLLGFGPYLPLEPHLSVGRPGNARLTGVQVHRPTDLDRCRRQRASGFWVTDAHRTALDMGAVTHGDREYFDLLAHAKGRQLIAIPGLWLTLHSHARPGRTGVGPLRRYLDQPSVTIPTPDVLEARLVRALVGAEAGRVEAERRLTADGDFLGRVDGLMVDHDVPVEADGWEVHGTPSGLEHDLARQNRLVLAGRAPLRYTWKAVYRDPARIRREVRQACGLPV